MHSLLYFDVAEITLWDYKTLRKCFSFSTSDASRHGGLFFASSEQPAQLQKTADEEFPSWGKN